MPSYTITHAQIPELPGAGRLGRHFRRDSRSAAYPYRRSGAPVISTIWVRHIPVLDQGQLGSCTGNMVTGALGTEPLYGALTALIAAGLVLDETLAVKIYTQAEVIDGGIGYPPEDEGSSGTSVCQASRNDGYISGYTWCNDENDVLDALMAGPVGLGINWYSSFDTPDAEGIISLPRTATVRGGHEIVARKVDVPRQLIGCDNSWGSAWGRQGCFWIPYTLLARLLSEQGDCVALLPVTAPAPVPVPVPSPVHVDAADLALAAGIPAGWETAHHVGPNGKAAQAYRTWRLAKGL